jgi:hypothetical protein
LPVRVSTFSIVADDSAVALLVAFSAGIHLRRAVLPVLVGGLLPAAVARPFCAGLIPFVFAFVEDCVAFGCCTGCDGVAFPSFFPFA